MEYTFLLKNHTHKLGWRNYSKAFSKKSKLRISLDQWSKVLYSLFLLYPHLRAIEIQWNQAAYHLFLPYIKLFQKTKRSLKLVSLIHFLHDFLFYWLNLIVWLPLVREKLSNTCIVIVCQPGWDIINFKIKVIFII